MVPIEFELKLKVGVVNLLISAIPKPWDKIGFCVATVNVGTDNKSQTGIAPIEIDIKREIAIGKVDQSAVKSQEFKGKVKNKKNKLKALRHKKLYEKQMGSK